MILPFFKRHFYLKISRIFVHIHWGAERAKKEFYESLVIWKKKKEKEKNVVELLKKKPSDKFTFFVLLSFLER